ncbi:hypothetical protein WDZ92_54510 [Nostoc sp. NIES-2111]
MFSSDAGSQGISVPGSHGCSGRWNATRRTAPLGAKAAPEVVMGSMGFARRVVERDATDAFAHAVFGYTLFGPTGEDLKGRLAR